MTTDEILFYSHYELGRITYEHEYRGRFGVTPPSFIQIQESAKRIDLSTAEYKKKITIGKLFKLLEEKKDTPQKKVEVAKDILAIVKDPFRIVDSRFIEECSKVELTILKPCEYSPSIKSPTIQPPPSIQRPPSISPKNITPPVKKHKNLSKQMRYMVWNHFIGEDIAKHKCFCCKKTTITQQNYECGHVISRANGGEDALENMRPICGSCNRSMSAENMIDYILRYKLFI